MAQHSVKTLYRVLDLPGFRAIEDMVVRHGREFLEDFKCDLLSKSTFGLTYKDTLFNEGKEHTAQDDYLEYLARQDRHESSFETAGIDEYLVLPILDRLGLDFRNDYGQPLKCTKAFCRQAEYAIKNQQWTPASVLGREDVMADRLSADVDEWLANKGK